MLVLLSSVLPYGPRVTMVAGRDFAASKSVIFLKEELSFVYLIRLRANIYVEAKGGEVREAAARVGRGGRMRRRRNARVTAQSTAVPVFACVWEAGMKDVWALVSSRSELTGGHAKQA
jgi:hypothetical protein